MYYIGYDIGSSSIKAALVEASTGKAVQILQEPASEMHIEAKQNGWAEQNPDTWFKHICIATKRLIFENNIKASDIKSIGIAYQMHGLVLVDINGKLLRNSIIWCDSRAVSIGQQAFKDLGEKYCASSLLNSPANFTASKLKWVNENEPELFNKVHKFMLPGDYIAYRLSGVINTTITGLSEGVFWDFKSNTVSKELLDYFGIPQDSVPNIVPAFGLQSSVNKTGANLSGLAVGTEVRYRAGDQPNNALALNVFNPGEVAATGGTSGVVYAVTDSLSSKEYERVNNFAHVNYNTNNPMIGKLLCINGAGILYRWLKENLAVSDYNQMNDLAEACPVGSDGVVILPFGNGAERMLKNKTIGTQFLNVNLNRHNKGHLCRAALEGIAFSFVYGMEFMNNDDLKINVLRAGNDNLFRSKIFSETISTLINQEIEIYNTTGAVGAARAAGIKDGDISTVSKSVIDNDFVKKITPITAQKEALQKAYTIWKSELETKINQSN